MTRINLPALANAFSLSVLYFYIIFGNLLKIIDVEKFSFVLLIFLSIGLVAEIWFLVKTIGRRD